MLVWPSRPRLCECPYQDESEGLLDQTGSSPKRSGLAELGDGAGASLLE
jgi:hypothetical protein